MAATLTAIAKKANVSIGLVSRLFKNDPTLRISSETLTRVLTAKESLGGIKGIGNTKITKTIRTTGLTKKYAYNFVVPVNQIFMDTYQQNTSLSQYYRGMEDILKVADFRLSTVFFDSADIYQTIKDLVNSPDYCDGLFITTGIVNEQIAQLLLKHTFPHVSMDEEAEKFGLTTVSDHLINGTRKAVKYLLRLGHTRIGYMGLITGASKYLLLKIAMAEQGIDLCQQIEISREPMAHQPDEAKQVFGEAIDKGLSASAIICQTDAIALGAVEAMKQRDLEPGKDISIIGHDNIEQKSSNSLFDPILTTVDSNARVIGRRCGEILLNQVLHNQRQIVHEYLPVVDLIVRKTTGQCPSCNIYNR